MLGLDNSLDWIQESNDWEESIDYESSPEKEVHALTQQGVVAAIPIANEMRQVRSRFRVVPRSDLLAQWSIKQSKSRRYGGILYRTTSIDRRLFKCLRLAFTIKVPDRWVEEGCEQPSFGCRQMAARVLVDIHRILGMLPSRVGASRVGGIMLLYRSEKSDTEMEIEVDNELDAVGVISTRRDVLASMELDTSDDWQEFARKFRSQAPRAT